jgi:hypothetical protein
LKLGKETNSFQAVVDARKAEVEQLEADCAEMADDVKARKDFLEVNSTI